MLAAILVICGTTTMTLTSCSDDDDLSTEQLSETEAQQKAEMKKSLVGLQVDFSDFRGGGGDNITFWMFEENGTFTAVDMEVDGATERDDDRPYLIYYEGTWEPFVNAENPWDPASEKLSGFKAIVKWEGVDPSGSQFSKSTLAFINNGIRREVPISYQNLYEMENGLSSLKDFYNLKKQRHPAEWLVVRHVQEARQRQSDREESLHHPVRWHVQACQ